MSENKNAFGLENSWVIYVIGALSMIEAFVYAILHYVMLTNINVGRELAADIWWIQLELTVLERITFASFGVQAFRFICALALILGRLKGSIEMSAVFCILTIIGIFGNIATGFFLVQNEVTKRVAVTSLMIIAIHIVYIVICLKICRQEQVFKKKASSTSVIAQHQVEDPVQLQYASPVEDTEQAQPDTSIQAPDRIENNFHRETSFGARSVVENRPDRPPPVWNGTFVSPSHSHSCSPPREPPPSYEEEDTGPSRGAETKQEEEDPPQKVYI